MAYKPKRRVSAAPSRARKEAKARGMMERMRRRQRLFLAILASLLVAPVGAYGVLAQLMRQREGPPVGKAYGREVSTLQFRNLGFRMRLTRDLVRESIRTNPALSMAYPRLSEDARWELFRRMLGVKYSYTDEDVWQRYVLLEEARRLGLEVAPQEVDEALGLVFPAVKGGLDRTALEHYLTRWGGIDEDELRRAVAEDLLVGGPITALRTLMGRLEQGGGISPAEVLRLGPKLRRHLLAPVEVCDDEVWALFLEERRTYRLEYLALSAEPFLKQVPTPTQEALRRWYDDHKDTTPEESVDGVGYRMPPRCRVHYFVARVEDFKKRVKVSEEELRNYYERVKDRRFRLPSTMPASAPTTRSASRPTTSAPSTAPARSTTRVSGPPPRGWSTSRPASSPSSQPTTTRAVRYRPLAEVREELLAELIERKARKAATEATTKAGNERIRLEELAEEKHQPVDYRALAAKFGLTYVAPTGLVTRRQLQRIKDLRGALDRMGRTVERIFFGPITYDEADLVDPEGNAFHVWRTDALKERTLSFDEVRERALRDWRLYRAYEMAGEEARRWLRGLQRTSTGDTAALQALARKRGLVLHRTEPFRLTAGEGPRPIPLDRSDTPARAEARRWLFARFLQRNDLQPGEVGLVGDPLLRIQYLIRVAERVDPPVGEFRRMRDTYRLLALSRKRRRFLRAWMEEVRKRADVQPVKKEE